MLGFHGAIHGTQTMRRRHRITTNRLRDWVWATAIILYTIGYDVQIVADLIRAWAERSRQTRHTLPQSLDSRSLPAVFDFFQKLYPSSPPMV